MIVLVITFEKHKANQQNELVVFHQFGNTVIGRLEHQQLIIKYQITNYQRTPKTSSFLII